MIRTEELIQIDVRPATAHLHLSYERRTERTIFDICDLHGRILKTGIMAKDYMRIPVAELATNHYVLLVLDGDRVYSRKFSISW